MAWLLNFLLICVPASIAAHYFAPEQMVLTFFLSAAGIIPLAGWLGRATEEIASRLGEGFGGFLNATFGNAAELIIAIAALRDGHTEIVKASLTGSIIGNILLVLGLSLFIGGLRHNEQPFNKTGALSQSTMLLLATTSLVLPAVFHYLVPTHPMISELSFSLDISLVLLGVYAASLIFSLGTHKMLFSGGSHSDEVHGPSWSVTRAVSVLVGVTLLIAILSEVLVASVEGAAHVLGMSQVFIGVIVVAIVGNAAEHSSAVLFAIKDRCDLTLGIAIGSSIQIALFVAPLLVLLSYFIAPVPMDLLFTPVEVISVGIATLIVGQIAGDGKSNWFEGLQLLAVYMLLGLMFYFIP